MKTFEQFLLEARTRPSQRANKYRPKPQKAPEDSRQKAYVTIGPPASGKSSLVRAIKKKKPDLVQAELDQSRKALGKSPAHFGQDIIQHQNDTIRQASQERKPLVVSNTSIPKKHREGLSNTLQQHGYKPVPVLMPASAKAALRRNRNRPQNAAPGEGRVPDFVMRGMGRKMKGNNTRKGGGGALSRKDRKEARKNYKELHREFRFTKPNLRRG
jgi:hypothetical protein